MYVKSQFINVFIHVKTVLLCDVMIFCNFINFSPLNLRLCSNCQNLSEGDEAPTRINSAFYVSASLTIIWWSVRFSWIESGVGWKDSLVDRRKIYVHWASVETMAYYHLIFNLHENDSFYLKNFQFFQEALIISPSHLTISVSWNIGLYDALQFFE